MKRAGFLNQPRAIFVLAFVEAWERFSFYGLFALLVLYLSADRLHGGLGWSTNAAIRLFGEYSALAYATPILGGWLADRWLGRDRALLAGAVGILCGHLLLGFGAYQARVTLFFAGLLLVAIGTGLFKPTIALAVARQFSPDDPRRQIGFALFWVAMNMGALLANLIAGTLGETVGWHYGFGAAAVGMAIAIAGYLTAGATLRRGDGDVATTIRPTEAIERAGGLGVNYLRFSIMGLFGFIFFVAFLQKGGLLNVFARDHVNRSLFGHEIPATWLLSINPLTILILAPVLTPRLATLGRVSGIPPYVFNFILALLAAGAGYCLLAIGAAVTPASDKLSMTWLVAAYVALTLGEIALWPAALTMVSQLSPAHWGARMMGLWYLIYAIANWLAAVVGTSIDQTDSADAFLGFSAVTAFAAALLWLLRFRFASRRGLANDMHASRYEIAAEPVQREGDL